MHQTLQLLSMPAVLALAIALGVRSHSAPLPTKVPDPRWIKLAVKGHRFEMEFARIPKGKFIMGSPEGEKDRSGDEDEHEVEITRDYWMGKTEVTRGQFRAFVADTGHKTAGEKSRDAYTWKAVSFAQTDEHPVVYVSWSDAKAFCDWLAKKSGRPTRLPTEAEWERACRGNTQTRYHFGDEQEDLRLYANVLDEAIRRATKFAAVKWGNGGIKGDDGHAWTAPVRSFRPNAFGLYDMHGNVCEWCADQYHPYKDIAPTKDPEGVRKVGEKEFRILRGGCFLSGPEQCRAASRCPVPPWLREALYGFRVAFRLD